MSSLIIATLQPGDLCWVENLSERWGGGLAGVVFQGHYMGPLDTGELHHVKLMEDNEDLRDVMQNELKPTFELKVGDILACCNEETDGDGLFEGELIEFLEGGHIGGIRGRNVRRCHGSGSVPCQSWVRGRTAWYSCDTALQQIKNKTWLIGKVTIESFFCTSS